MAPKKSRSNQDLGSATVLPLRNLMGNQEREEPVVLELGKRALTISRLFHEIARLVQMILLIVIISMLAKEDYQGLVRGKGIVGISVYYWLLSIGTFGLLLFFSALYFSPFLANWKIYKIVIFEMIADSIVSLLMIIGFISQLSSLSGCSPGSSTGCDQYNTVTAFTFFSILAWAFSLYLDAVAYGIIKRFPSAVFEPGFFGRRGSIYGKDGHHTCHCSSA